MSSIGVWLMERRLDVLLRSMSESREHIAVRVLQERDPAWWTRYRNTNWQRSAYLRRRRGWAPK